jgi:site-specific recombinase XerD
MGLNPYTFSLFIETYILDHLPILKKSSSNTVRSHHTALKQYLGFLRDVLGISEERLTIEAFALNIRDYLDWVEKERNCSIRTRNSRLASIRGFLHYVAGRDPECRALVEAADEIPEKKFMKDEPVLHMSRQACRLVADAPDQRTKNGRRDRMMMSLLYETAIWVQELASLTLGDVSLDLGELRVAGKGGKHRVVGLDSKVMSLLAGYIAEFHGMEESCLDKRAPLFYHEKHGRKMRLTEDRIRKMIAKHAEAARKSCTDVPERVQPHLFRSSKAVQLLEDGMALRELARFLGHEKVSASQMYMDALEAERRGMDEESGEA